MKIDVNQVLKKHNTVKRFEKWLNKDVVTLDNLRAVRQQFLQSNMHDKAQVVFLKMKEVAKKSVAAAPDEEE